MKYQNPILPGFHPDPSVCRVGNDFYMVTSTFEYFPGLPLFHSTDLVHWEQIGHVLNRESQLKTPKGAPNCIGIYAPTIRYHAGVFYCIVTNVGGNPGGNFFVTTTDIYGEWSDPVYLDFIGIDPSLFFDDDGKVYYTGTDDGIFICEIDKATGKRLGEKHYESWSGTGANNPEGPHLYKIDGWYYLMIAEGGTEMCHMECIARSKTVYGPYEACPHNPVLTNRGTDLSIKAAGHADLVQDANGNWWAVCLGIRPVKYPFCHILGRETMLVPVKWENGWPVMGVDGHVAEEMEVEQLAGERTKDSGKYIPGSNFKDDFLAERLHDSWNTIYNPVEGLLVLSKDGLMVKCAKTGLSEDEEKAILVRRQEHFGFATTVEYKFAPEEKEEAGLTIYMNPKHHYEIALTKLEGKQCVILRRQIGSLKAVEEIHPYQGEDIVLKLTGTKERYEFSYAAKQEAEEKGEAAFTTIGGGETWYLSTETGGCFTGNYIGIYASANGAESENRACATAYTYEAVH